LKLILLFEKLLVLFYYACSSAVQFLFKNFSFFSLARKRRVNWTANLDYFMIKINLYHFLFLKKNFILFVYVSLLNKKQLKEKSKGQLLFSSPAAEPERCPSPTYTSIRSAAKPRVAILQAAGAQILYLTHKTSLSHFVAAKSKS
jgi:hypothetical protein